MNIRDTFIKQYINRLQESDYIGVEIELPIVNSKYPYTIDERIVELLFKELLKHDFEIKDYDNEGNIISIKNKNNGDTISLEYSFNTIELSLDKEINIFNLKRKFDKYYESFTNFLENYDYKISCTGINPNYKVINRKCLNQNRYKVIERLLINKENDLFSQFCSYCCSVQTHINISKEKVIDVLNMLTVIEDNKSSMFANSYMEETKNKNSRKKLWERSNFGPLNTGKNKIYTSIEDLIDDYLKRKLFYVERENKYLLFKKKQTLEKYFNKKKVIATDEENKEIIIIPQKEDFLNFRSYKSVELTRYGTLEIRNDCTPNFENIFKLISFNVGVCACSKEILDYITINKKISNDKLKEFAIKGLKKRSYGEEKIWEE